MAAVKCVISCLLIFASIAETIIQKKMYGQRGGSVELPVEQLPEGTKVSSIIWMHGRDKVAEWFEEDEEDVTYFGQFHSSTALSKKTWGLKISDLQPSHTGMYSAVVNNNNPTKAIHLIILKNVYGQSGESIELPVEQLPEGRKVTSIIWKHGRDKVAEWFEEDGEDVTYFGQFKTSSTLNKKTWALKISDLQPSHTGMYSAEVNNNDPTKAINLIILNTDPTVYPSSNHETVPPVYPSSNPAIKTETVYGLRGGTIELPVEQLPEGKKVSSIIWKHGKNKVAEWFEEDGNQVTYFGQFYSSTALNKKTWGLKISDLQPSHTGVYSAEVNNNEPTKKIHLIILHTAPPVDPSLNPAIETETVYGLRGGSIELLVEQLPEGRKVTSIIWIHGKDKVAEWFEEDGEDVTYFGKFDSSTALNKKTWSLKISDLQPSHTGNYKTEVNNKDPTKAIHLIILNHVSSPNITKECNSTSCTLICKGEESEHTQYSWTDNKGNRNSGDRWTVDKSSVGQDEVFTCNFSNPVSWKTSNVSLEDESRKTTNVYMSAGLALEPLLQLFLYEFFSMLLMFLY